MGRLIDFIRGNVFWVLMALAVAAIALTYVFVSRDMARDVEELRKQSQDSIAGMETWAREAEIPNRAAIEAAKAEAARLKALHSQLMLAFARQTGPWDEDFASLRNVTVLDDSDRLNWRREYDEKLKELVTEAEEKLNANRSGLPVAIGSGMETMAALRLAQKRYWQYKYIIGQLIAANASGPEGEPVITKVTSIGVNPGGLRQNTHAWLDISECQIRLVAKYADVPGLIASLANAPLPISVTSWTALQTARPAAPAMPDGGRRAGAPRIVGAGLDVQLTGEVVTFRPLITKVKFGGALFKTADAIRSWLTAEDAELQRTLKAAMDGVLEAALDELKAKWAEKGRELRLKATEDGSASDERAKEIVAEVKAGLEKGEKAAREKILKELERASKSTLGFALAYSYLYGHAPQKAYFYGSAKTDQSMVLVRAPDNSPHGAGRWWLAKRRDKKPFKYYTDRVSKKRTAYKRAPLVRGMRRGADGASRVDVMADAAHPEKATLFFDAKTRAPVEVLIGLPGGYWRRYTVVQVDGKAVSLSDAAFRGANAIQAALAGLDANKLDEANWTLTLTPPEDVRGGAGGKLKIVVPGRPGGEIDIDVALR
jgi:hypothetical protein